MYFTKVMMKAKLAKLGRNVATFRHKGTAEQSLESVILVIHNCSERIKLFISLLKENYYFLWLQGNWRAIAPIKQNKHNDLHNVYVNISFLSRTEVLSPSKGWFKIKTKNLINLANEGF